MRKKTGDTLIDKSMVKATFDMEQMNRNKNYLMDWLTFINDSSELYRYMPIGNSYRTIAPQILFVENGDSEGCFNGKPYQIKKGDLILKPADTQFSVQSISRDWKMRLIEFRMPQAMRKKLVFFQLDIVKLSARNFCRIKNYFDLIADCMEEKEKMEYTIEYLALSLLEFINVISADAHRKKRVEKLFEAFMEELLKENGNFSREVSFYARKLGIAPNYLGNAVRTVSGKPVRYWINTTSLHRAQEMLRKSSADIKEISAELGFKDAASFSRFFRRHAGMTPTAYRKAEAAEEP